MSPTTGYKWLDETDRSRVAFAAASDRNYPSNARFGFGNDSQPILRRPLKAFGRLRRIEPKIAVRQRLTTLLVIVMVLQHYTRLVPFP